MLKRRILSSLTFIAQAISLSFSYFVQVPPIKQSLNSLQLSAADRIGANYQGIAYNASTTASIPNFALSLDANFGSLKEDVFHELKDVYSGWSDTPSLVMWKANEEYTLLDFLPPFLQATSGLHFHTTRSELDMPSFVGGTGKKRLEQEVLVAYNCWGFAWEVLRAACIPNTLRLTISTADPSLAWDALTKPSNFQSIQSSKDDPSLLTDSENRNKNISAGDVLLVWHQNVNQPLFLDHVAIVLDDDLYYEKSGSGDHVPFRVNTWDGLAADFPPAVFHWDWKRFVRESVDDNVEKVEGDDDSDGKGKEDCREIEHKKQTDALPSAQDAFGLQNFASLEQFELLSCLRSDIARNFSMTPQYSENGDIVEGQTYTAIIDLEHDLVFDDMGRASLPESAFLVDSLQPTLPPDIYTDVPKVSATKENITKLQ